MLISRFLLYTICSLPDFEIIFPLILHIFWPCPTTCYCYLKLHPKQCCKIVRHLYNCSSQIMTSYLKAILTKGHVLLLLDLVAMKQHCAPTNERLCGLLTVMAHEIDHASLIFCYLFPTTNLLHTLYLSPMEAVLFIELPSSDSSAPHVLPPATKSIC